jgi:hypothetical protein
MLGERGLRIVGLCCLVVSLGWMARPASSQPPPGAPTAPEGKRWLLSVGTNESYDAEVPSRPESAFYAWAVGNKLLNPDLGDIAVERAGVLIGTEATKKSVEECFAGFEAAAPEDTVIIYLCLTPAVIAGEDGKAKVYLCTYGVEKTSVVEQGLSIEHLTEMLAKVPAERKIVFLDFSPWDPWRPEGTPAELSVGDDCYAKLGEVCAYISSVSPGEKLQETTVPRPLLGFCLSNAPDGLLPSDTGPTSDGEVSVGELWSFIKGTADQVYAGGGARQTPIAKGTKIGPTCYCKAPKPEPTCPAGMKLVGGHVCVDIYELPNLVGAAPTVNQTLFGYAGVCQQRGKRSCEPEEWEEACLGPDVVRFGYGETPIGGYCNIGWADIEGVKSERIGSRPLCVNGYGLYDMIGNVAEYVGHGNATPDIRGGSFRDQDINQTDCRTGGPHHPVMQADHVGSRCCADPRGGR